VRTLPPQTDPVTLLQRLVQFDTTNPPGNEAVCIAYIADLLRGAGVEPTTIARDPARPNLIARLEGRGDAPPLLMYGHIDVVTAEGQSWRHPPFAGEVHESFLWGRGTLDMKGGVAMMLAAFLRTIDEGTSLPGDVILAVLSDEEAGSDVGARFLVEEHAHLFDGVKYAIGEFGGFTMHIGGRPFYPIMVSEKQICWMQAKVRGRGGHGSMPVHGEAMSRLADALAKLDRIRLPVHVTPPVKLMFGAIADELGGITGGLIKLMLRPALTDVILGLMGDKGALFDPLLHNTVSPTMLVASDKVNVIPSEVTLGLDGRLVPGQRPGDLVAELHAILGPHIDLDVIRADDPPPDPDLRLFGTLSEIIRAGDPAGVPVPLVLSGTTDGRYFAKLGIQTYGFLPMKLPKDFNFSSTIHGVDERVPVEAVRFGADAIHSLLQRTHD